MINPIQYLPIMPALQPDELLSSWLVRTSLANGADPLTWTSYYWGKWRAWTVDIDRFCPTEKLQKLVNPIVPIGSLVTSTLYPTIQQIVINDFNHKKVWPWVSPLGSRNRERVTGLRFCPLCLKEDKSAYYRKSWRLTWTHSCLKHNVVLLHHCSICSMGLMPHKATQLHSNLSFCIGCGSNLTILSGIPQKSPSQGSITLQKYLDDFIKGNHKIIYWNINDKVELFATIRFLIGFLYSCTRRQTEWQERLCNLLKLPEKIENDNIRSVEQIEPFTASVIFEAIYFLVTQEKQEAIKLLRDIKVTQGHFRYTNIKPSDSISSIFNELLPGVSKSIQTKSKKKIIEPKSKELVDKRINRIMMYAYNKKL